MKAHMPRLPSQAYLGMGDVVLEMKQRWIPSLLLLCLPWKPHLKGLQLNICIVVHEQNQSILCIRYGMCELWTTCGTASVTVVRKEGKQFLWECITSLRICYPIVIRCSPLVSQMGCCCGHGQKHITISS